MKARVDPDKCIGCQLCVETCPAVFSMEGDTATAFGGAVPREEEAACRQAAEGCPVEAIAVEETVSQ